MCQNKIQLNKTVKYKKVLGKGVCCSGRVACPTCAKKFLKYTERQYLGINKTNRRGVSMLWAKI
jgi:hypothetical protein